MAPGALAPRPNAWCVDGTSNTCYGRHGLPMQGAKGLARRLSVTRTRTFCLLVSYMPLATAFCNTRVLGLSWSIIAALDTFQLPWVGADRVPALHRAAAAPRAAPGRPARGAPARARRRGADSARPARGGTGRARRDGSVRVPARARHDDGRGHRDDGRARRAAAARRARAVACHHHECPHHDHDASSSRAAASSWAI